MFYDSFDVLVTVKVPSVFFRIMTSCWIVGKQQRFGSSYCSKWDGIPYPNLFLFLNFIPELNNIYRIHLYIFFKFSGFFSPLSSIRTLLNFHFEHWSLTLVTTYNNTWCNNPEQHQKLGKLFLSLQLRAIGSPVTQNNIVCWFPLKIKTKACHTQNHNCFMKCRYGLY
jgi:hypothetical protein